MIEIKADMVIDTKNETSPGPVVRVKKAIDALKPGQLLKIISNDPGSAADIMSWCKTTKNELVHIECEGRRSVYYILKK
jgi:TusA-related sulfurtransferase